MATMSVLTVCMLIIVSHCLVKGTFVKIEDHVLHMVDKRFLSFTIDSQQFSPGVHFQNFNFSSPKVHRLMSALAPAILRIGGSPADWLVFDEPIKVLNASGVHYQKPMIVMTKQDWDNLVMVTMKTGVDLLFEFNLQLRFGEQWDPGNAIKLLEYSKEMGYGKNLHFELGNEPSQYHSPALVIPAQRIAQDYISLWKVLRQYPNLIGSGLVGPDVVADGAKFSQEIIGNMSSLAGKYLSAITIHQYYFEGGNPNDWAKFINPEYFGPGLSETLKTVETLIKNGSSPNLPLWIGETADCWHSGTENVTNRYISSFLWLDKLGTAAANKVSVVTRQTFYGYYYSLIDNYNLDPNPDYWVTLLHRYLAGEKVLGIKLTDDSLPPNMIKLYAHCTSRRSGYPAGAVTVFGLNISPDASEMIKFLGDFVTQKVDVYLLRAGDPEGPLGLLSRTISLNGKKLSMISDTELPKFTPVTQQATHGVQLPSLSLIFMVFPNAGLESCK